MMALETLSQPPINRIDLSGEWDGNPGSEIALHANIEFISAPNTRLPLLDLSNGVELLQYNGPTEMPEDCPSHLGEISDEKSNGSTRGGGSGRQHPDILKRIANGGTESLSDTPRTLYRKGMELSPSSTKRRLFPPSPTSTVSRMPSFDDLAPGLEIGLLSIGVDEDDGLDGEGSKSTDVSTAGISESSGTNSAAQNLRLSDTYNREMSSLSSAAITPKSEKRVVSRIPVKSQRLARPSSAYEEFSHSSEPEGNLRNTSVSSSKTESPPSEIIPTQGNEIPPMKPSTHRNEQFSPVKLSHTLSADLTKSWVDQRSPQSRTRNFSHGVGGHPLFDRRTSPQSELGGSQFHTQYSLQSDAAIFSQEGEPNLKYSDKSMYVSTWLGKDECNGLAKEYHQSRLLCPTGYSTEPSENHNENSPTNVESHTHNTDRPRQSETHKPVILPSPFPSSQQGMPWNSAEELARKRDSGTNLDTASTIPVPELAIVEEVGKDFYILSPETSVPKVYIIEFDFKVRLRALQPGGWQLLKIPGLPVYKQGGKGTVKLTIPNSSARKKLDCGNEGFLSLERDGAGFIADFDIAEPLVVSMRAVELLSSESRDKRILNHEIRVVLRCHQKIVEYTAICALSFYQKILCADEGSIAVIISDGPVGDFEWTMENGNRDFHVDQRVANASDLGTTKIRIFCKGNELDGCFRITWEVPYETQASQTWVPKLFCEKPATQAEYVPSLRSQWRTETPGTPMIRADPESGESGLVETEKSVREWGQHGFEDLGYLGLPAIETESIAYWCVHQLVRVVLLFMAIMEGLGGFIQTYLEYVPLGPKKIILLPVIVVQTLVLINQHLSRPSTIECQENQPESIGLSCPRRYFQIEPCLSSFSLFVQEKVSVAERGLLGHIFKVVNGRGEVTFIDSENVRSAETNEGEEGALKITAAQISTHREFDAATPTGIGVGSEAGQAHIHLSTSNQPQTKLKGDTNSFTTSEGTTTGTDIAIPTKASLRDRIDMFFGWTGPLE
ncbi:carbonic anhydrase [Histoplasma ohiense]|nr:carbonic anhydrase [Histoplasma ohiense (nom. inval.)]